MCFSVFVQMALPPSAVAQDAKSIESLAKAAEVASIVASRNAREAGKKLRALEIEESAYAKNAATIERRLKAANDEEAAKKMRTRLLEAKKEVSKVADARASVKILLNQYDLAAAKATLNKDRLILKLGEAKGVEIRIKLKDINKGFRAANASVEESALTVNANEVSENLPFLYSKLSTNYAVDELLNAVIASYQATLISNVSTGTRFDIADVVVFSGKLGKLIVTSRPSGATITVDGEEWDTKTKDITENSPFRYMIPGPHRVVTRKGNKRDSEVKVVVEGKSVKFEGDLK